MMMRPKLLIPNRNLSNLYCIVLYKTKLIVLWTTIPICTVCNKTRLYVTSFWWFIVNWFKYYLRICIENLWRRLKTCIYYRRWRLREPWRSTGWSGERCRPSRSQWPLCTGAPSLPHPKLVFTAPLQDEDLCHWPDCGKIQVTKVQHRVDLYAPVPGFGTFWDSWGSSRRPLERLSLLRRSGRRSLSRSRTLASGFVMIPGLVEESSMKILFLLCLKRSFLWILLA